MPSAENPSSDRHTVDGTIVSDTTVNNANRLTFKIDIVDIADHLEDSLNERFLINDKFLLIIIIDSMVIYANRMANAESNSSTTDINGRWKKK